MQVLRKGSRLEGQWVWIVKRERQERDPEGSTEGMGTEE
jgi:hypothetical protein